MSGGAAHGRHARHGAWSRRVRLRAGPGPRHQDEVVRPTGRRCRLRVPQEAARARGRRYLQSAQREVPHEGIGGVGP
eukprot:9390281-Pyramimonas_sp.AAC.1